MNETKKNEKIETKEEKKENLIQKAGKKVGAFFKKAWPWLLGTGVLGGAALAYILIKDDENMNETESETTAE